MNSNLWKIALAFLPILGTAAEFTTPTRFSAAVEFGVWTNRPTISQASNLTGGASAATGTFSYAVQPTNSLGRGITSASSNASFTATGQLIRIRWNPVGGATGYRIFRGLTNWIDASSATQFLDYGTNTWSNGAPTTTTTAGAISGPLTIPTNTYLGTAAESNRVATLGDIGTGSVTTNDIGQLQTNVSARLDSNVWAAAASTTNYVSRTGSTMTGTLITTNDSIGMIQLWGSGDFAKLTLGVYSSATLMARRPVVGFEGRMPPGTGTTHKVYITAYTNDSRYLGRWSGLNGDPIYIVWDSGNDGSGSTLDADLLDGLNSTDFVSSAGATMTGGLTNESGFFGNGAGLTNLSGSSSVTLRTNPIIKVSSHPGSWAISSDVPAGGGGSMAFELPTATATQYRATFRSSSTATVTRTIQAPIIGLSSVATNWAWLVIDHATSTNFLTNVVSFATVGATSALFSVNCTTAGLYWVSGTNAAGNRELIPTVNVTGAGNGTTNYGRAFMPRIYGVEQ